MNYFKVSKFFLFLIPLTVVIVTPSTLFPFIVGKYAFFRTMVSLALICFLLGMLFQDKTRINTDKKRIHTDNQYKSAKIRINPCLKNPLVIAVSIFVSIFLLACLFGVDPKWSFWSNFERGEGGLQILYLGIFFWLLVVLFREEKDWQIIFWISILVATLVILYGIAAHLKYIDAEMTTRIENGFEIKELTGRGGPWFQTFKNYIGPSFKDPGFRFAGSLGNPAYTASYFIFALFYAGYLLIKKTRINTDEKRIYTDKKSALIRQNLYKSVLLLSIILFLVFFWLAATRGAFVGLLAAIMVGAFYFAFQYKKYRKPLIGLILIGLMAVGLMVYFRDTPFVKSLPGSRIFQITLSAETWQHRTYMWQTAIEGFKERPLLGWGPENFIKIFDKHFPVKYFNPSAGFGAWFDRAHSIYFDYLAETGILGLLSYLSIFIVFYWQLFRAGTSKQEQVIREKKQVLFPSSQLLITNVLLFSLPIAYLVQGIVLFEILPLYINLFLFLAFANYKLENRNWLDESRK